MALLQISFDKDGNHKKTSFITSDSYYRVSVDNNILKDNAIFCHGYSQPPNLFTGEATCFDILNKIDLSTNIPDWITYSVNTDQKAADSKSQSFATPSGIRQIYASRYNRTTTFGVLPQLEGGAYRKYSFYLTTGFHVGKYGESNTKWIQEGYDYDSFLQIEIDQDSYSGQGGLFSNPYYCTKRDNIFIEEKVEVEGEAEIYIYVKADGIEYSCNKLSLALRHYNYNFSNIPDGDFNILNNQNIINCHISEVPDWIQYNIEDNSLDSGISVEEWIDSMPFDAWLNLQFTSNNSKNSREAIINIQHKENSSDQYVKFKIHIIQDGKQDNIDEGGDNPEEGPYTGDFVVVDINTGEDYDSYALLLKDNDANIYSTLEAKDNTLFLGNYLNTNFSLQVYSKIGDLSSIYINDGNISVPLALNNSSTYSYTPNMCLSSQMKRLFKKGETYSLGLVFIRKNGVKSTVFYIGDYSPSSDPFITLSQETYLIQKPQAYITLNSDILNKLKESDIIGVIPVCAQRSNHKIICQGFLNPTISSRDRSNSENLTAQYNWFQRLNINDNTCIAGENENTHNSLAEFQSRSDDDEWRFYSYILTMNTPEVEVNDYLTNSELENCVISPIWKSSYIKYINSVQLNVNGKYLHSKVKLPSEGYRTDRRETCLDLWHGFIDKGTLNENSSNFIVSTKDDINYGSFYIYPWQRNTV